MTSGAARPEHILVVEDEETLRRNLTRFLEQRGHSVTAFADAEAALASVPTTEYAVALVDLKLPGMDGLTFAERLFELSPETGVLIMTAYSSVESVVEALRRGAHDYLIKPVLLKDVAAKIEALVAHRRCARENACLRRQLARLAEEGKPVVRSRAMAEVFAFVEQIADSSTTLLIEGESGTGKEVVARALHAASPRRNEPFLAINAAAIPESLIESHLFGHVKGAFTGAEAPREGVFRAAHRGTLFLDEIGDLPLQQQAKLLRALEAKEILPVGSDVPVKVECRVVAATNANLAELVQARRFRSDLYYRLSTIRVRLPALRARPDDIPALAAHFLTVHGREHGRALAGFEPAAMRRLLAYQWPGNVRELSNVVERAVIVAAGPLVRVSDLAPELTGGEAASADEGGYHESLAGFERSLLLAALERAGGDRREAARQLGVSLATLYRRIDKLGLRTMDSAVLTAENQRR
jgi:DNA-binding NtrC family response regulator